MLLLDGADESQTWAFCIRQLQDEQELQGHMGQSEG